VCSRLKASQFRNVAFRFTDATREDDVHDAHRL
jgi:hypothetical protein